MLSMPIFSVLIPTKNRLDLLKDAIETVRRQTYDDWEIIVSDNNSDEDIGGYVSSLKDSRIKHIRSNKSLPVTDNWNRAIDASTGEHVIMLGDDDGLTPDYFTGMLSALSSLESPDLIFHGGYHFAFPGVMPDRPEGYLSDMTRYYPILASDGPAVAIIPKEQVVECAKQSLRFHAAFGYNAQYFLFSRKLIDRLRNYGKVYQGPYPDYFSANMAFLLADRVGRIARPMTLVGISKKSFGNFYFNARENEGEAFLDNDGYFENLPKCISDSILPGSGMNTSWLVSVALIPTLLRRDDLVVDVQRYRNLQITVASKMGNKSAIWGKLTTKEKVFYAFLAFIRSVGTERYKAKIASKIDRKLAQYAKPNNPAAPIHGLFSSRLEVFEYLKSA
jgi:glycosyltransferase involved in cell wall biosynthesis